MKKLKEFKNLETDNLFTVDKGLQATLAQVSAKSLAEKLKGWEKNITRWNVWANEAARAEKLPRIERFDNVGNPTEKIILPLETKNIRREVVEQGIFKNESEVEKFAKIYLLAQIGESGVTCPLACTDGLIRVLDVLGSDFLKKEYLPKLLSAETPLAGAQFVTEQSGGSDVGAIESVARQNSDGTWSISGEKWYCSVSDEYFMVLARPEGAPSGTEGLAIFFVPRVIEKDGRQVPNGFSFRRLKNKLGTQSLPTAEIDFTGACAWLIGKPDEGFHNLMTYILNVSRVHNAANSLGFARRAFAEGLNYANQRVAFGREISGFPLIQHYLLDMLSSLTARRHLYFVLLQTMDQNGLLPEDNDQRLWQRFLINLMKYRTAFDLTEKVKKSILVFGANGIVEDFSIVPRLLRDSIIIETWEGPHNTLCLQIVRDSFRFDFYGRLIREVEELKNSWPKDVLSNSRALFDFAIDHLKALIASGNLKDNKFLAIHAKTVVDSCANLLEVGHLVRLARASGQKHLYVLASYLAHHELSKVSPFNSPVYSAELHPYMKDILEEKPLSSKFDELLAGL